MYEILFEGTRVSFIPIALMLLRLLSVIFVRGRTSPFSKHGIKCSATDRIRELELRTTRRRTRFLPPANVFIVNNTPWPELCDSNQSYSRFTPFAYHDRWYRQPLCRPTHLSPPIASIFAALRTMPDFLYFHSANSLPETCDIRDVEPINFTQSSTSIS